MKLPSHLDARSLLMTATLDPRLRKSVMEASEKHEFQVVAGYVSPLRQAIEKANGRSHHDWPNSLHNQIPAREVDIVAHSKKELADAIEAIDDAACFNDWRISWRTEGLRAHIELAIDPKGKRFLL